MRLSCLSCVFQCVIQIVLHCHCIMDLRLVLRTIKDVFHLPVRHCGIQLLHITEFLYRNYVTVCTIWQRNLSGISFYILNSVSVVFLSVSCYCRQGMTTIPCFSQLSQPLSFNCSNQMQSSCEAPLLKKQSQ